MSKETGGNAFPIPNADFQTFEPKTVEEYKRIQSGMTLRDYFVAKAMQAIIHRYDGKGFGGNSEDPEFVNVAEQAYFMADAMLEARK